MESEDRAVDLGILIPGNFPATTPFQEPVNWLLLHLGMTSNLSGVWMSLLKFGQFSDGSFVTAESHQRAKWPTMPSSELLQALAQIRYEGPFILVMALKLSNLRGL
jgi:hypothetical protein